MHTFHTRNIINSKIQALKVIKEIVESFKLLIKSFVFVI